MTQDSPNSLSLEPTKKVNVAKMSRWPLYAALVAGTVLFAVLVYSVNFSGKEEEELKSQRVVIREDEKPVLMGEGSGLAKPPKDTAVIAPPQTPIEPIIVVQKDESQNQDAENIRRVRSQASLAALSAPLAVKKTSTDAAPASSGAGNDPRADRRGGDAMARPTNSEYDPAADKDKEEFFGRAKKTSEWMLEDERTAGQTLEVKTGAVIPGVMLTGINSDLPGQIIAQVSQNVFDTVSGRHLLIPQGAKLFGVYDSRVVYGQSRVLVAWNRVVYPDGSSVSLGAMPGTDMSGYGGYEDDVNNHYFRIFGSAVMMSLITGGAAYAMDTLGGQSGGGNVYRPPTMQDQMTSALAAQMGQTTTQLLQKNLNIKPTLGIRPGYQFNIIVAKDIVFRAPYTPTQAKGR